MVTEPRALNDQGGGNAVPYTLVQHSAFVAKHDLCFARAVELRSIDGSRTVERVRRAGGIVIQSYADAADLEYRVNYPPSVSGMIPACQGRFAKEKVEWQRVYRPVKAELDWIAERQSERRLGGAR
jgi:hypothetical protein